MIQLQVHLDSMRNTGWLKMKMANIDTSLYSAQSLDHTIPEPLLLIAEIFCSSGLSGLLINFLTGMALKVEKIKLS